MGPIEWITLILIVAIIGYILMNQSGIKVVDTSETVEISNRPNHQPDWDEFKDRKDRQRAERKKREAKAESLLLSFVEDYRQTGERDLKSSDIKFLEKMDDKIQANGGIQNAQSYFNFMKNSFQFYQSMKNIGNMTAKSPEAKSYTNKEADQIINKIFSVEQEKLEIFTEDEPDTQEWLEFLGEE